MPELPEVETIRADLARQLAGRQFTGAEVFWERTIARPAAARFGPMLAGRRIVEIGRRGKFLVFGLDQGATLVAHLRMTGRLRLRPAGAEHGRHLRAVLYLDGGEELHFEDQRKFGRLYLVCDESELQQVLAKVGPEPLASTFTLDELHRRLDGRRARLKPLLLDQRFLAGLGNIYADEALFRARLHPLRRSDTLVPEEVARLHEGILEALREGIRHRGTTLASYRDAWGTAGRNQERLLVFRQQGRPCPRCGTPIEKLRVAGRGTHVCPSCQPLGPASAPSASA